jgi:hypothetical protein
MYEVGVLHVVVSGLFERLSAPVSTLTNGEKRRVVLSVIVTIRQIIVTVFMPYGQLLFATVDRAGQINTQAGRTRIAPAAYFSGSRNFLLTVSVSPLIYFIGE